MQAPKTESAGRLTHDKEARGSADTVNDAVCAATVHVLIRGDLLIMRYRSFGNSINM